MRKTVLACALTALAVGGTSATAASLITGKEIRNGSITAADIKKGSITANRLSPGLRKQLATAQAQSGQPGAVGAQGPAGAKGDTGQPGQPGANGTNGTNGSNGVQGVKGDPGANADGSITRKVSATGDQGFTIGSIAGTGAGAPNNATTTIEDGKLRMQINATGGGFSRAGKTYNDVPVQELTSLLYKFNVAARNAGTKVTPALKIDVIDATPCDYAGDAANCKNPVFTGNSTTLVYEPTYSDGQDSIQAGTVDALGSGNKWWSTRGITGAKNRDTFVPFATILAGNPNMKIKSIYVDAGQNSAGGPWNNFDGTVDWFTIGFDGEDAQRYDFG